MEELCKHYWLLSKVALPLSKFSTLGAQVTEFQSSLHSSLSFVQYSHRLGHYKTGELGWVDWKSMTGKCSLLYGLQVKDVKTFMSEDEKVSNLTLLGVQKHPHKNKSCWLLPVQ